MKNLIVLSFVLFAFNGAMSQWVQQNSGTSGKLNSVFFLDADTGFAAGSDFGNGLILKTENGGETCAIYSFPEYWGISSIFFTDYYHGFVAGTDASDDPPVSGMILNTRDGGLSWSESEIFQPQNTIFFPGEEIGYSAGFGTVFKTLDSGFTWGLRVRWSATAV